MRNLLSQLIYLQLSSSNETQTSCYQDQSDDRGCSVALHNSKLIYFALSFIHLLAHKTAHVHVHVHVRAGFMPLCCSPVCVREYTLVSDLCVELTKHKNRMKEWSEIFDKECCQMPRGGGECGHQGRILGKKCGRKINV